MTEVEPTSDSEITDLNKITDAESCLNYLKRREVFLYKMMNDPGHKAMLYFLEVLMNAGEPITVEELAARFTHKTFSQDMREACGGGSPEGLKEFLSRYPSLFNVKEDGHVTSVGIELSDVDCFPEHLSDFNGYCGSNSDSRSFLGCRRMRHDQSDCSSYRGCQSMHKVHGQPLENACAYKSKCASSVSLLSIPSHASVSSESVSSMQKLDTTDEPHKIYGTSHPNNRRGSNPSLSTNSRARIYQHPHSRDAVKQNNLCRSCATCDQVNPGNSYMHCPLIGLSCHHQCAVTHHLHHHHHLEHALSNCICPLVHPSCHSNPLSTCTTHILKSNNICSTDTKTSAICALPPMDKLVLETEAVRFFQQKLTKREERWVPIKSLAGHLSQATQEIRAIVGPQIDFRNFLLKHPHVFEIQGELVSVKNAFDNPVSSRKTRFLAIRPSFSSTNLSNFEFAHLNSQSVNVRTTSRHLTPRPKSLIVAGALSSPLANDSNNMDSTFLKRNSENRRSTNFSEHFVTSEYPPWDELVQSNKSTPVIKKPINNTPLQRVNSLKTEPIRQDTHLITNNISPQDSFSLSMSANEYRTIMFVRKVLNQTPQTTDEIGLDLNSLLELVISDAPESVKSTIGWTNVELEEFLSQYPIFFMFEDPPDTNNNSSVVQLGEQEKHSRRVYNKRLEKMVNIIITRTKPPTANSRSLINQCGRIYHVAKLWGIIDLGKHEHVFFDKSIFKHVDDLQKYFKVNEVLYFNAILAPKESRAKWRATQVWKECDRTTIEKLGALTNSGKNMLHNPDLVASDSNLHGTWGYLNADNNCTAPCSFTQPEYEDTEADEEIEDIVVDSGSHFDTRLNSTADQSELIRNSSNKSRNGMNVSEIAREEGLNLPSDMRFITRDPTEAVKSDLRTKNSMQTNRINSTNSNSILHELQTQNCETNGHLSSVKPIGLRSNHVSSSTENNPSGTVLMKYANQISLSKDDFTASTSSTSSNGISIAVQTVSTGDIMATQLYHDLAKPNCQMSQM